MVKILDKYVFTESLKFFLLSLVTFLVLFVVIDFVSNVDLFLKVGMVKGISYVLFRIPLYTSRILPIAVLVSSMVTLSRFSSTSELIAVKSLGISLFRFSLPVLFLSLLSSLFSFSLQEFFIPNWTKKAKILELEFKKGKKENSPLLSLWFKDKDKFVHIDRLDSSRKKAFRISLFYLGKDFKPYKRIDALEGERLKKNLWLLKHCVERDLNSLKFQRLKSLEVEINANEKLLSHKRLDPETMELFKLYLTANQLSKLGYNVSELLINFYSRISLSFMSIVVALIGIPLGTYNPRNKKGWTVAIASLLIVFMWITVSFFLSLGKTGILPPFYAAFAPLFLFLSVGLILFSRLES